jgi:cytochrome c peroxidase
MKKGIAWLVVPVAAFGLIISSPQADTTKPATRKAEAKKPAARKAEAKKPAARKADAKKPAARKVVAKKAEKPVVIPQGFLLLFRPLPKQFASAKNPLTPAKINLGRMLYYDTRLSKSHKFSCNSCHLLDKFGVDNKQFSDGHAGKKGDKNSPTVYNAAAHVAQFWDGRSPDVEDQARHPILNPVEMAAPSEGYIVKVLKSIPGYAKAFKAAYPKAKDPITYTNMAKAIGAFERKLVTPSRWDRFLKGDKKALTNAEKKGFMTFFNSGCITCHTGPLLGGHMYQKLGLMKPWPGLGKADLGRFNVTKNAIFKNFFKVPSLRNVEKTAPYLHNGSVKSLHKVVEMMAWYQLGRKLTKTQVNEIVTFLKALTGTIPTNYIKVPKLPASSATTPKPVLK